VLETRHGAVIAGDPLKGHALTLKSVQFAETDLSFDCLPRMLRAESVPALFESTRGWGLIDHNLVAADTHHGIGWLLRARIPRRGRENGWLPVPGWSGDHEWQGWIAHEDMPALHDPEGGLIVTANNRIVAEEHPDYLLTDCHPPYRARRVLTLLQQASLRSPEGAATIHADVQSQPARDFIARLATLRCEGAAEALRAELTAWDARMDAGSVAAARYIAFRLALTRRFAQASGLGALAGHPWLAPAPGVAPLTQLWWALPALLRADDASLLNGADWNSLLREALTETAADLPTQPWGEAHRPRFTHPLSALFPEAAPVLDPPSQPIGGDGDTVFANGLIAPLGPRAQYGALSRYAFDVGAWENSRWSVFLGASGHPGSPHYADQHTRWANAQMTPMRYAWEGIEAAQTQLLQPA
jgi:penicillin amidase